jgi:RecB family endonuclease NucS
MESSPYNIENVRAKDEATLYPYVKQFLQKNYPIIREQFEIPPNSNCFVDFYGFNPKTNAHHFVEVKNEQLRIKHMEQLMKYLVHIEEHYGYGGAYFTVIVSTISKERISILARLGIQVITLRTLKNLNVMGE